MSCPPCTNNCRQGRDCTTRRHPRTLREAFPGLYRESAIGIAGPAVIPTRAPWWVRLLRWADAWMLARKSAR